MDCRLPDFFVHGIFQTSLSMAFSRQEYWSALPFSTPGKLLDPGIEPMIPESPALVGRFFTTVPPGKPQRLASLSAAGKAGQTAGGLPVLPEAH